MKWTKVHVPVTVGIGQSQEQTINEAETNALLPYTSEGELHLVHYHNGEIWFIKHSDWMEMNWLQKQAAMAQYAVMTAPKYIESTPDGGLNRKAVAAGMLTGLASNLIPGPYKLIPMIGGYAVAGYSLYTFGRNNGWNLSSMKDNI